MLAPVTHIRPLVRYRRSRLLPINGKVLVHIGQRVQPADVVAEAVTKPVHILLDLKGVLGRVSTGKARKMIQRRIGEHVDPGDVIASSEGLFERVLRAPQAGVIDYLSADIVMLQVQGPNLKLMAGIPGEVVEIIPDRGVVIEMDAVRIQAAWGNGKINGGPLTMITDTPDEEINAKNLSQGRSGEVLVGGFCTKSSVLRTMENIAINGLVLGSMAASLIELAQTLSFPIVLVDGFGNSPMNDKAFELLKSKAGRNLSVLATQLDPYSGERPEILIEETSEGEASNESDVLVVGQTVRILGYPYFGCVGVIESMHHDLVKFPSGLRSPGCMVKLNTGQVITIPTANLDILDCNI